MPGGDVTIASHTGDDEWTVVDEGHLNPDGSYDSDQSAAGGTSRRTTTPATRR